MRAIQIDQHGGPEILRIKDVPVPEPGPGEVRVRVRAVGINHLDIWTRKGIPGVKLPLPVILGSDVVGVVDAVGSHVDQWKPGDKVAIYPAVSCHQCEACIRGLDNRCPRYSVLGHRRDGGYADYIVVPAGNLMPKPDHLSWEETAAIPLVFLTAWHMLVTLARIQPGEDVLVMGGSSGVGSAAIQIARFYGCRVITTAGTEEKRKKALELGADIALDHSQPGWGKAVREATDNKGVDIVFEHVGQAVWPEIMKCLGWHGRLVTCGATTGTDVSLNLRVLFGKQWSIYGAYMGTRGEMLDVWRLVMKGIFRPVLDRVFPLEKAEEAHRYIEDRKQFGKVVLKVSEDEIP